jgi:tetratricopeptide (TPR) repeat protein
MSTSAQWRTAKQLYHAGQVLFQEHRYAAAVIELHKAEEAFRSLDARGHPWGRPLDNGVSGLANTLALLGHCYEELGHYDKALTSYETCRVNEQFERKKSFRIFLNTIRQNLVSCYERALARLDDRTLQSLLSKKTEIDPSFKFPFSLTVNAVPIVRLYELSPERHKQFKDFYNRVRTEDASLRRRAGRDLDDTRMKQATFSIWMIFGLLWIIYSLIVVKALLPK